MRLAHSLASAPEWAEWVMPAREAGKRRLARSQNAERTQRTQVRSQKARVLVPVESLTSCGTEPSHLTSLLLVSSPRDGESLISARLTYFLERLGESNECERCWETRRYAQKSGN